MSNTNTVPVGKNLLGRVLNVQGQPIDNKGPLSEGTAQAPLLKLGKGQPDVNKSYTFWETGIKPIDLLAPVPYGGLVGVFGGPAVGKLVVIEEYVHNLTYRRNGYAVALTMSEFPYELTNTVALLQEGNLQDVAVTIYEPLSEAADLANSMLETGLTIADTFRAEGRKVLLVIDSAVAMSLDVSTLQALKRVALEKSIMVCLSYTVEDPASLERSLLACLDTQVILSQEMAQLSLWPAIDRLRSTSQLFTGDALSAEHKQVVERAKGLLTRAKAVQEPSTEEQRVLVQRAQRLQRFLTQPFFIAEEYTEIPGEYVSIDETVHGVQAILNGVYDTLPLDAFLFVGSIDQAVAKAQH